MPLLLTAERYALITGAAAGTDFETVELRAVRLIESALSRELTAGTVTVELTGYRDGWAYPSLLPVVSATDEDGVELVCEPSRVLCGRGVRTVVLSYGYTVETAPAELSDAVAWAVHTLRNPVASGITPGVTSLSVAGEFSVSVAPGVVLGADGYPMPKPFAAFAQLGGRALTLAARYRRAGGAV